jgi:lipopolysaccharide transport system ATP-binding protein
MSETIIQVENLGKKYRIGKKELYYSLRDRIANIFDFKKAREDKNEFWALKNVNLTIKKGESIGIIGRNGAGKSTLLKVLSRITPPTEGKVTMHGRVASLLEVGTGFNPELTGRENIFLNGAILGMTKKEIKRKFDEIVAFAEIEQFLDTPVKRYSSGMYMRLAFAVAAHLESEILIIDEVLAVGDAQFQMKCLGKMDDVAKNEGRTVLFVSHNIQAIKQLCSRAILLESGNIVSIGKVDEVVDRYLGSHNDGFNKDSVSFEKEIKNRIKKVANDEVFEWLDIDLYQVDNSSLKVIENGKELKVTIKFKVKEKTRNLRLYFNLIDDQDNLLLQSFFDDYSVCNPVMEPGIYLATGVIPKDFLSPVNYTLSVHSTIHNVRPCEPKEGINIPLNVVHTGLYNRQYLTDPVRGKLAPVLEWETKKLSDII